MAQLRPAPPTEMERTMEQMITVYQRYAGKDGEKATMTYAEFENFMKTELCSFTKSQKDPNIIRKMMASVDGSVDGKCDQKMNFQEFLNLLGGMMVACNEALLKAPPSQKQPPAATPPTEIETAMERFIRIFQHYAGKKGDKGQMDYLEFDGFMRTELKSFVDNQKDPNIIRKLMESVDGTVDGKQDKQINFQEFMNLTGGMMTACHEKLLQHLQRV